MMPPKKSICSTVIVALLLIPSISYSQMFSVEEPERRARPATNALLFGLDFIDISFRPDSDEFSVVYDVSAPIYRFRLDLPGIEAYAGFRTNLGDNGADADTLNYLNLGANISGAMPVTGSSRMGIVLPIWLTTDFTQVRSTDSDQPEAEQFRQSSASVGIGAGGYIMISNRIRIRAEMVPQIGFTVSALGSDSGQLGSLKGRLRIHMDQIVGRFGLVAGYNYSWHRYTGGEERLRYDISSHNVTVGVSF